MKIFGLLLMILVIYSCNSENKPKSERELHQLFTEYLFKQHPELRKGKHVLFIVNKVDCSPCIAVIERLMNADYTAKKQAILSDHQRLEAPSDVRVLKENPRNIAPYGMLEGDGKICLLKNGKLTLVKAINIDDPDKLIRSLHSSSQND